jgi:hypothetical protein
MTYGPPLCSFKRGCEADLGSSLQPDGRTFWHEKDCGSTTELLERQFWDIILGKIISIEEVHSIGAQEKKEY